jgi:hypothetical protein
MPQGFKDWKIICRVTSQDGKVTEYTIQFYRPRGEGNWYDRIRYDSHETRKGRREIWPHFHMKLMSSFKSDEDAAIEEIKHVIENYITNISKVIES